MPILPFTPGADPAPHQAAAWQQTQAAVIAALGDTEDHLVNTGIPRTVARVLARDTVLTFLHELSARAASAPVMRVLDVTHDWLSAVYANPYRRDRTPGA